jgi:hypothetical protein
MIAKRMGLCQTPRDPDHLGVRARTKRSARGSPGPVRSGDSSDLQNLEGLPGETELFEIFTIRFGQVSVGVSFPHVIRTT